MAKRSKINIILIASLFIVTALLIVTVTFLAITLGKNSDQTTCTTPQSQPCDQKTVLPYYFSVLSRSVSYENVISNYTGSAWALQNQITKALNSVQNSERSADQSVLDANSNMLPVMILGISNGTGGVLVIASTVFTGTSLPNSQSIITALNTNDLLTVMIANGSDPINSGINTQLCQQVNPVSSGGTTTNTPSTLPSQTTSVPATTSNQPTQQPTQQPSTQPTTTPPFPCQRNIFILFDSSNGMNANQYLNQTAFISHQLFTSSWTFDQTNVAIAAYDDTDPFNFRVTGSFGTINNLKQAQNALHISQDNDVASIMTALLKTADPATFPDAPPNVKQSTVLFASTSVHADILGAVQYARQIRANGPLVIIAMGPSTSVDELNYLTSKDQIFAWPDYNNVPADLVSNIIQAICSSSSTATPILPTGTTPAITSSAPTTLPSAPTTSSALVTTATILSTSPSTTTACTGPPPTVTPSMPCQTNVIFIIDGSDGITDDQFKKQAIFVESVFQMKWTYNEISIAIGEYSDPSTFYIVATFGEINNWNDTQKYLKNDIQHFGGDASLTKALQKTEDPTTFTGGMGCVQKAVVLFTSTSIDADVATAQQYADAIKKNGPLIIVAMGPNASASKLSPLSSPTPVIQWPDYNNVPVDLASNIIQAICPSYSTATPVQPTGSTPAITSAAPTTSSAPVTTAMPSSTFPPTTVAATTPPPTVTGPFPCQRNIIILFDSSNGMNANQYLNQTTFISHQLFTSSWTFDQTNVAVAAYDDTNPFNFRVTGAFGNIKNLKQAQNALHISQGNDVASITTALNLTTYPATFPDAPPNVKQSTVLFASTSVHTDIQGAVQYANQITANGPLVIVAMGPSASVDELSSLTPRNQIFAWLDYNNVPADLVSNIIQAICPPS